MSKIKYNLQFLRQIAKSAAILRQYGKKCGKGTASGKSQVCRRVCRKLCRQKVRQETCRLPAIDFAVLPDVLPDVLPIAGYLQNVCNKYCRENEFFIDKYIKKLSYVETAVNLNWLETMLILNNIFDITLNNFQISGKNL